MPRFFFDIHDGADIIDETGTELPSLAEVQSVAVQAAAEAIRDLGAKFWDAHDWRLEVRDERRALVLTLRFSGEKHVASSEAVT